MFLYFSMTKHILSGLTTITFILMQHAAFAANDENAFPNSQQLNAQMLVDAVLQRNPDIPTLQAAWRITKARIDQVVALDDPMIVYSVAPRTANGPTNDLRQSISLSQRMPWPGKLALRGDAARFEAKSSFENIEKKRLELTLWSKQLFADWYFIHAALRINNINKSLLQEFYDIAQTKYIAGTVTKQDVLLAEIKHVLLQQRDVVLQRRKLEIQTKLNILLDQIPDTIIPAPAKLTKPLLLHDVVLLRENALRTRPELRALQNQLNASHSRRDLAEKNYYPDFNLKLFYNGVMDPVDRRSQIGIGFNYPLRGKRDAAKDEANARLIRLELQHRGEILRIKADVQQAYDQVQESEKLLQLYRQRLLPLAEETLAAAQADYENGRSDFLSLINAEKQLITTQLNNENTLSDYHSRLAKLEQTVGSREIFSRRPVGDIPHE